MCRCGPWAGSLTTVQAANLYVAPAGRSCMSTGRLQAATQDKQGCKWSHIRGLGECCRDAEVRHQLSEALSVPAMPCHDAKSTALYWVCWICPCSRVPPGLESGRRPTPRAVLTLQIPPQVSPLSVMLSYALPQPHLHISLVLYSLLEWEVRCFSYMVPG